MRSSLVSLDAEGAESDEDHAVSLMESVGGEDRALEHLEDRATLEWALSTLGEPPRKIVRLRFFLKISRRPKSPGGGSGFLKCTSRGSAGRPWCGCGR